MPKDNWNKENLRRRLLEIKKSENKDAAERNRVKAIAKAERSLKFKDVNKNRELNKTAKPDRNGITYLGMTEISAPWTPNGPSNCEYEATFIDGRRHLHGRIECLRVPPDMFGELLAVEYGIVQEGSEIDIEFQSMFLES